MVFIPHQASSAYCGLGVPLEIPMMYLLPQMVCFQAFPMEWTAMLYVCLCHFSASCVATAAVLKCWINSYSHSLVSCTGSLPWCIARSIQIFLHGSYNPPGELRHFALIPRRLLWSCKTNSLPITYGLCEQTTRGRSDAWGSGEGTIKMCTSSSLVALSAVF